MRSGVRQVDGSRGKILLLPTIKRELVFTNLDDIALFEHESLDWQTINQGAIGAAEVLYIDVMVPVQIFTRLEFQPCMIAANSGVFQMNITLSLAANCHQGFIQGYCTKGEPFV